MAINITNDVSPYTLKRIRREAKKARAILLRQSKKDLAAMERCVKASKKKNMTPEKLTKIILTELV